MEKGKGGREGSALGLSCLAGAGWMPLGVEDIVLAGEDLFSGTTKRTAQRPWGPQRQGPGEGEDIWEKKDEQ